MKKTLSDTLHCMSPQLVVVDLNKSILFYTEQLGFTVNFRYEEFYAGLGCGGHSIHLKAGSPSQEEMTRRRANEDVALTFGVTDLDAIYETVLSKDIEVIQPLRKMPYGREFFVSDPDGYILAFFDVTA